MKLPDSPALPPHEWLAVAVTGAFLLFLLLVNIRAEEKEFFRDPNESRVHSVHVSINGAVSCPGVYICEKGKVLQEILDEAGVSEEADLSDLHIKGKILKDLVLHIKTIKKITVYLEGAVSKKGAITVPRDTTLKKVIESVQLLPGAHIKGIGPLTRKVTDGEVIKIELQKNKRK